MGVIVVDLDGTLYNSSQRNHLAQAGQWDEFHKASANDDPYNDVLNLINQMSEMHNIIGCTGRTNAHRQITFDWLMDHGVSMDHLLMRPDNNFESDTIIKPKLLEEFLEKNNLSKESVLFILEDRDKMVERWRDLGYNCWQVRPGGY